MSADLRTVHNAGADDHAFSENDYLLTCLMAGGALTMRCAFLAVLSLLAPAKFVHAQTTVVDHSPLGVNVGAFAGLGSGPIDAGTVGADARIELPVHVALVAEYSMWGNGMGGTDCTGLSHRCSINGSALLAGAAVTLPVHHGELFAAASGGVFKRDWLGDDVVRSRALSLEAGVSIPVYRRVSARLRIRALRAYDDQYREMEGEDLRYRMGIIGLEYSVVR